MNSNIKTATILEDNLRRYYGTGIKELREYATGLGTDLTIRADGLWISRPGYSKAIQPNMPVDDMGRRMKLLHVHINVCADILWEKNDPKPAL